MKEFISYLTKGAYQQAFNAFDAYIRDGKDKKYEAYWCYAYLAKILSKEKIINLPLPEAFCTHSQLKPSANQIDSGHINPITINLALMDYKTIDFAVMSCNIGDYIQTVAVMRHIARHLPDDALIDALIDDGDSKWQIESASLKSSFAFLRESWSEDERRNVPRKSNSKSNNRGKIVIADRDCAWNLTAHLENNPESNPESNNVQIWYPIFGWFADSPFAVVPVLPLPSQYLPIFFSFHIQYPEILTDDAIAYLKRFAPIGCRDIATRDLLMNQDIDAFFSGCVTTTLAFAGEAEPSGEILDVDADMKPSAIQMKNQYPAVKTRNFDENIEASLLLLQQFRNAKKVITSRLHCYLPTRALGGNVFFTHKNMNDSRFDGLIDIDDNAFATIRDGLTDLLDKILGKIMAGDSSPDKIYAYWRELTMPFMEQSNRERRQYKRFFMTENKPVMKSDTPKKETIKTVPPYQIPVALAFDKNIADYVPALINSIDANKSCNTRYIMLTRDIPDNKIAPIEKACKQSPIQWFAMDDFLKDEKIICGSYITISCMDRLFLPELLPDTDKIIYLDIDVIVEGDITELYQTDLLNAPLAAREENFNTSLHVRRIENDFYQCEQLLNMRKSTSVSLNMLDRNFNSGVLVLSLEKMRQDNFTERAIQLALDSKMPDQHILNFYTKDNYIKLSPIWNAYPHIENPTLNEQKIFHWIGGNKPWNTKTYLGGKDIWQKYADMN